MDKRIFLLSGPVRSGKTTHLLRWITERNGIGGILSPVVNDRRVFRDIGSGFIKNMEAERDEEFLPVGRYRFSKASFNWANDIIRTTATETVSWLVIDEVGPLELNEEGFYTTVRNLLDGKNNTFRLLLVVRDSILDSVISKFKLEDEAYTVVDTSSPIFD